MDIKLFKTHYHKTKRIYDKLAQKDPPVFNLNVKNSVGISSFSGSDKSELILLAVLMRRFLNNEDKLYYKSVWNSIVSTFSDVITSEQIEMVNKLIKSAVKGEIKLKLNNKDLTAEDIYSLKVHADFFGLNNSEAIKSISSIIEGFGNPLIEFVFYSYNTDMFKVVSAIFDVLRTVENSDEYKNSNYDEINDPKNLCIFCKITTGSFTSEEHPLPESLGNYNTTLPKGFVCDKCNNTVLSGLDAILIKATPLRSLYVPYTKSGKLPEENYQNVHMEKIAPAHIRINPKDRTGHIKNEEVQPDGSIKFSLPTLTFKFVPKEVARSLYKVALEMVAFHQGREAVLDKKYDSARNFILLGKSFNNNLLMQMGTNDFKAETRSTYWTNYGGTIFELKLYGIVYKFNLEEKPTLELNDVLIAENYKSFPLTL